MSRFPHKKRAAVGGSLENFILDRNFQSRSKSRVFLIFGPSGNEKLRRGPGEELTEPNKGSSKSGLVLNSCFLRAPYQLMKRFSLQSARFGLTFTNRQKGQNVIFQCTMPSGRHFPCRVCEFHCEIPFSDVPL